MPAILLILSLACAGDVHAVLDRSRLTMSGFGPIRIGMTEHEAERALGFPVEIQREEPSQGCHHMWPRGVSRMSAMVENGRITRIDLSNERYVTLSGLRVGDSEALAMRLYAGRLKVTAHQYVPEGHYITVRSSDGKSALVIETNGRKVTAIRAGVEPSVSYIEGCL